MSSIGYQAPALVRLRRGMARRLGERDFWIIQGMILLITVTHIALEAAVIPIANWGSLPTAHHIPVILYLVPVTYAGLVYGWEGGVLTGLWSGALASINLVLFSLEDYEWVLEAIFVFAVIGMGVVMSLSVERERRQRRRAETVARRLETLNHLAAAAVSARTPAQAANVVLAELVRLMDFDDAGYVLWRSDQSGPMVRATYSNGSDLTKYLEDRAGHDPGSTAPGVLGGRPLIEVPITTENVDGLLIIESQQERHLDSEVRDFLVTVGNQLAVRVENAMLLEQEQDMLSTYVRLVTEAQEEERRRLARDLHDGPAQHLAILVRKLEDDTDDLPDSRIGLRQDASEILGELRRVARDQRPTLLDDLGIVPALEWLISETDDRTDLAIGLEVKGEKERLDPVTEVALYRIAQEALRNAERHAGASTIVIMMCFGTDRVELTITDDGPGFEVPRSPGEYLRSGRLGLMGMHERAQLVGGSLEIRSDPGTGTVVLARVGRHRR